MLPLSPGPRQLGHWVGSAAAPKATASENTITKERIIESCCHEISFSHAKRLGFPARVFQFDLAWVSTSLPGSQSLGKPIEISFSVVRKKIFPCEIAGVARQSPPSLLVAITPN